MSAMCGLGACILHEFFIYFFQEFLLIVLYEVLISAVPERKPSLPFLTAGLSSS